MKKQVYNFKFSLFGKKVQLFQYESMGIVVEKEADVVCVYGTDSANHKIFCAIPLSNPRTLKGMTYEVSFYSNSAASVAVGDIIVYIDYEKKKCANNRSLQMYGSDEWGQDVAMPWSEVLISDI